jgi:ABC-type cobalamin/Fe3+-siderophores transport system ATPase subunit
MEQSFSVSNKIVMMDSGTVKKTGTPDELADDREDLVKLFGAAVKKVDDENLVFPYVMVR